MSPALARVALGLIVLLCAAAQALLLRSVLRMSFSRGYEDDRRKGPRRGGYRWGADRRSPDQPGRDPRSGGSELAWVIAPAIGLAALLYYAWLALPE